MQKKKERERYRTPKIKVVRQCAYIHGTTTKKTSIIRIMGTQRDTLLQNTTLERKYYHTIFCCLKDALYLE